MEPDLFLNLCFSLDRLSAIANSKRTQFGQRERSAIAAFKFEMNRAGDFSDAVKEAFRTAYKSLGAPGDFGYGTPEGKALKELYDDFNACCKQHKERMEGFDPIALGM